MLICRLKLEILGALQKSGQETQIVGIVSKGDVKSVLKAGKSDKKIVKDGNPLPILPMDPRPKKDQGLWAKEIRVNQTV